MRQDPDKILVGEIRDLETIEIAVKAALTGHLVLSTLHTNDSAQAILRMVDMGVDPFMVASAVLMFAAQRLTRKLCPDCKLPVDPLPKAEKLREIGFTEKEIDSLYSDNAVIYRAVGCKRCGDSGYRGRMALLETLPLTDDIKRMIVDGASVIDIKRQAMNNGMVTVRRAGILNVLRGLTSIEEVLHTSLADFHAAKAEEAEEEAF
jgi:type IV pilus assembly protein PilB